MGADVLGFTPLNLLVVVLAFGLALLLLWPMPWQRPTVVKGQAKAPWPLKPKTGDDCPIYAAQGYLARRTNPHPFQRRTSARVGGRRHQQANDRRQEETAERVSTLKQVEWS